MLDLVEQVQPVQGITLRRQEASHVGYLAPQCRNRAADLGLTAELSESEREMIFAGTAKRSR